jgi:hypothetical protein
MAESKSFHVVRVGNGALFELERSGASAPDDLSRAEGEIEIVVAHIRRLARTASLEYALRVGAVIVHHFYDGDMNSWRAKGPKNNSFRQLARHPELPLSAGALYRCVALFELCDRLDAPSRWGQLGASHFRLVLGLPQNIQERMLTQANKHRWSVKVFQEAVQRERPMRATTGGRRVERPITRSLKAIRKCLQGHGDVMANADDVSNRDLQESLRLVDEIKCCLDRMSIQSRHSGQRAGGHVLHRAPSRQLAS